MDIARLPRPEPAAGLIAYHAEREACLALDARKRENYGRYLASSRRVADVDYLPVKLDVENVSRCNFACTMCAVSTWPKGKRAEDMSLEAFKQLIDEQYGLVEIKLNGLGEALMQGDEYFEMIRYARERRIWVRMTTNASLLHLRDNVRKLIASGVNEIDISIDGADAATFEGIRIQSDFGRVTANCKLLNDLLRGAGKPTAKMWTLVQKANHVRLVEHVHLAAKLGFRHLVFSTQLHGWGSDELAERNRSEMVVLDEEAVSDLLAIGAAAGVRVAFWDVSEKFSTEAPEKLCPWPFERAVVTSDSRTVPCCMIGDPDAFELAKGQTFLQAWKSADYKAFRQAHLDGNVPAPCKGCYR
jgi:sulfatase maturation enzyme AslB (radical SAM superfamily)